MIYAQSKGWNDVIWESDAEVIVDAVKTNSVPLGVKPETISSIREIMKNFRWEVQWKPRATNAMADGLAKTARQHFAAFDAVDESSLKTDPSDAVDESS